MNANRLIVTCITVAPFSNIDTLSHYATVTFARTWDTASPIVHLLVVTRYPP